MKYTHILASFCAQAWAIREETLAAMQELIRLQVGGAKWSAEEIQERINLSNEKNGTHAHLEPQMRFLAMDKFDDAQAEGMDPTIQGRASGIAGKSGTVALIPIVGIISHRMNMMSQISGPGGTSIQKLTAQFRQAMEDTNCKAIVFDVDSPGGSVNGVMELAAEIYNGRKQKPITAVFNSMGCSAAYWLASAASEVVCSPSGQCGSIGVYMALQDESKALENAGIKITLVKAGKYKTEGDPSQPITDEALAGFQHNVDAFYSMFVKGVAQNRGVAQAKVREGYGEGRSLLAQDAVKANLADRIATLDEVLAKYGVKTGANSQQYAANATDAPNATGATRAEDGDDLDETNTPCGCPCDACKGCTGFPGTKSKAKADDDMSCKCDPPCAACQGHTGQGGAKAVIAAQKAATPEEQKEIAAAAGETLANLRRRRMELMKMSD